MRRGAGRLEAGRQAPARSHSRFPRRLPAGRAPANPGRRFRVQTCACFFAAKITGVRQWDLDGEGSPGCLGARGRRPGRLLSSPHPHYILGEIKQIHPLRKAKNSLKHKRKLRSYHAGFPSLSFGVPPLSVQVKQTILVACLLPALSHHPSRPPLSGGAALPTRH